MSNTPENDDTPHVSTGQRFKFIPPKADALEKIKEGQGVVHELPYSKNWEKAIDALHWILEKKWYYIMIATNTQRGRTSKILKKGMNLDRQNKNLPEELQIVLKMQISTFEGLDSKIRETQLMKGSNKDIWHFKTQWKEFPEGTKVIVLHQPVLKNILFSSHASQRRAFVVIDGKCKMEDQNLVMLAIKKVFKTKGYCESILKRVEKARGTCIPKPPPRTTLKVQEERTAKQKEEEKNARLPAGLVLLLLDNFEKTIETISDSEFGFIFSYFNKLKTSNEISMEHKTLESRIRTHLEVKQLKERTP